MASGTSNPPSRQPVHQLALDSQLESSCPSLSKWARALTFSSCPFWAAPLWPPSGTECLTCVSPQLGTPVFSHSPTGYTSLTFRYRLRFNHSFSCVTKSKGESNFKQPGCWVPGVHLHGLSHPVVRHQSGLQRQCDHQQAKRKWALFVN